MRVKKYLALTLAAILATTMLTACPWDQEEDKTDDASSVPVTSTDTSQDDDDHDSGDDDSQPTKPSFKVSAIDGDITTSSLVLDENAGTYKATFTTKPKEDTYVVSSVEATVTTANEILSTSWPDDTATRARTLSVRTDTKLSLTTSDNGQTFTLTGIPSNATSCDITVEFKDPGYTKTDDGTYMVYNADGLKAFADAVNGGKTGLNCTLTDDIDLENASWIPIGDIYDGYTGAFDGGGHTISGLQLSSIGSNNVGLFGYVDGGTVKNLNLEIANIFGKFSVGGIAGYNNEGTIQGCMVSGSVSGSDWVGGVVGNDYGGTITDCYWQAGTGGPSQGVGNGGGDTTEVEGNWTQYADKLKQYDIVIGNDNKPVPSVIANRNNNPEVSGLTQRVLDTARLFGL